MYETSVFGICIRGELDDRWSEFFHAQSVSVVSDGSTHCLTIVVSDPLDQAALLGLLNRLNALGLPLVSVQRLSACGGNAQGDEAGKRQGDYV
ncbi:MAG: hypothetical protein ACK2UA_12535 [Anaerolineae bacterium]|jgi:hypothetical protein